MTIGMMIGFNMTYNEYEKDWLVFRKKVEDKAKGKCVINNKNWGKLRDFHFEKCVELTKNPYGFVFKMINLHKIHKVVPSAYKVYYRYRKQKIEQIQNAFGIQTNANAFRRYR